MRCDIGEIVEFLVAAFQLADIYALLFSRAAHDEDKDQGQHNNEYEPDQVYGKKPGIGQRGIRRLYSKEAMRLLRHGEDVRHETKAEAGAHKRQGLLALVGAI